MNILFILCDDLGWKGLYGYGSDFYETPHLDRLAAAGMRFTNAYASCPVTVGITQYLGGHKVGALSDVPYYDRIAENEYTLVLVTKEQ